MNEKERNNTYPLIGYSQNYRKFQKQSCNPLKPIRQIFSNIWPKVQQYKLMQKLPGTFMLRQKRELDNSTRTTVSICQFGLKEIGDNHVIYIWQWYKNPGGMPF